MAGNIFIPLELPRLTLAPHHIVTFIELRKQLRNFFRLILQIRVHHNDHIAFRMIESRRKRNMMSEISREAENPNMLRIPLLKFQKNLQRIVARAIIDENNFVGSAKRSHRRRKPAIQLRKHFLLVIDRDDN